MQIAVSAQRSLRDVTLIADRQIKQKLENAKGVGQITIVGGARREMHVTGRSRPPARLQPHRHRRLQRRPRAEPGAARRQPERRRQGVHGPHHRPRAGRRRSSTRSPSPTATATSSKSRDIGFAEDSYEEPRTAARLDGVPAVTLVVAKQSGENTVDDRRRSEAASQGHAGEPAQGRASTQIVSDQSVFINAAVENIKQHLIEGSIFAAIIIFLFLANIRTTLIAAIAIPTSIISTFALMAAMGFTLNQITMLALTLMVGIVIDDAIIVLENIFRFIEEKHMPPFQAAIQGTNEIGLAVMATTLSLLAVFLPVGFMGGIVGRFMSSFGFTSAFAIAVSLLVSFTLTPMLTSRFVKMPETKGEATVSKDSFIFRHLDVWYTRMLRWSMDHRKIVVALSVLVVMSHRAALHGGRQELPAARTISRSTTSCSGRRRALRWRATTLVDASASRRISASSPA